MSRSGVIKPDQLAEALQNAPSAVREKVEAAFASHRDREINLDSDLGCLVSLIFSGIASCKSREISSSDDFSSAVVKLESLLQRLSSWTESSTFNVSEIFAHGSAKVFWQEECSEKVDNWF